jgi:mono/diheme cytochrome c family protein
MRVLLSILFFCFILLAGVAYYVFSGTYDIAASTPHWDITLEGIEVLRDRSILAHSRDISAPSLKDPKLMHTGLSHFQETCRLCHGAPGYPRLDFAMGLYPSPPELNAKDVQAWNDGQLYWIAKNGLKMTGMPAFGYTQTDEELWGIVAVVRALPNLNEEGYKGLVESAAPHGEHDGGGHAQQGKNEGAQ